ncbi:S1 RNA-binding domain-containing protein [Roseivirga sp.]|uniref:CvfB family protein n=1 Tax=Roseivirga sp. TaxID=1964215 RepID=UPI003B8E741C
MIEIGKIQTLMIGRAVEFGCYLNDGVDEEDEILIPAKYLPEEYEIGDKIEVFVYTDHMSRPIAVTKMPFGQVGDIVGLKVKQVANFGAFLDNDLEKDLFVPNKEQAVDMVEGRTYLVKLLIDHKTDRMIGSSKISAFLSIACSGFEEGEEVEAQIWQRTDLGFKAVINGKCQGLIYSNEIFEDIQIGDKRRAFVKQMREDGKIDLALQKQGYAAVEDMSVIVLRRIEEAGGTLALGDKSSPEEIKEEFGMSKKNFKRILGGLYKAGQIEIFNNEIRLKKAEG